MGYLFLNFMLQALGFILKLNLVRGMEFMFDNKK